MTAKGKEKLFHVQATPIVAPWQWYHSNKSFIGKSLSHSCQQKINNCLHFLKTQFSENANFKGHFSPREEKRVLEFQQAIWVILTFRRNQDQNIS